jgi:hypothetical protein
VTAEALESAGGGCGHVCAVCSMPPESAAFFLANFASS